ncbi:MAG TPA: hypothetical protein VFH47_03895, partial [Candidatus Thermoplasmatota archaeon]|nr:hypothetical protein [Candidatus Thermoplasmatota archaeon]
MRLLLCLLTTMAVLLAGCGSKATIGPGPVDDPCAALERDCRLDAETGILAGVVASEAIVPIANAKVSIVGPQGVTAESATDQEGRF